MKSNKPCEVALLLLSMAVLFGCTSQAVKDLSIQTINNNTMLTTRYNTIAVAFATQLEREAAVAENVGALLAEECKRVHAAALREFESFKTASRFKVRESFYEKAWRYESVDYAKAFDQFSKPLAEKAEAAQKELEELQRRAGDAPQDARLKEEIAAKEKAILAIAERASRFDLNARDTLRARLEELRRSFFEEVDMQLDMIVPPDSHDCALLDDNAAVIANDLIALKDALAREALQLEILGQLQGQGLDTLQANLKKPPFYKLIIQGAGDSITQKIGSLSNLTDAAIRNIDTKMSGFLDDITVASLSSLDGAMAKLSAKQNELIAGIDAKIARVTGQSDD